MFQAVNMPDAHTKDCGCNLITSPVSFDIRKNKLAYIIFQAKIIKFKIDSFLQRWMTDTNDILLLIFIYILLCSF